MISEKAADMIRGRKLAPFEPPTRIGAHLYRNTGNAHADPHSVQYRPLSPPPPQSHSSYAPAHTVMKAASAMYPPPMGQVLYPNQLERSLNDLSLASNGSLAEAANGLLVEQQLKQMRTAGFLTASQKVSILTSQATS